jgi:hypothetical protein
LILQPFFIDAQEGAKTSIYVATSDEINNSVFFRELLTNRIEFYDDNLMLNIPKFSEITSDKKDNEVRDLIEKLREKV